MSYRMHTSDKEGAMMRLARVLEQIPLEDQAGLLEGAERFLRKRESGVHGSKEDPYWFEHRLIGEAECLIADGRPVEAWLECLNESNQGRSGFTDQVRRIYTRPHTEAERKVSEELRSMIIKIATAILATDLSSKSKSARYDLAWQSVRAVSDCLILLGADVPQELLDGLRKRIKRLKKMKPESSELKELWEELKERYSKAFSK